MESRREPNNKGALPQVPSFRPPLRAGTSQGRCGPDPRKRDTVLAAVKDASRRLRRWPKRAILDCGCARCHWANAGRDEETALGRTKKLIKRRPTHSLQPHQSRRAATLSLQSSMHRICPQTLDIIIKLVGYHPGPKCRPSARLNRGPLASLSVWKVCAPHPDPLPAIEIGYSRFRHVWCRSRVNPTSDAGRGSRKRADPLS